MGWKRVMSTGVQGAVGVTTAGMTIRSAPWPTKALEDFTQMLTAISLRCNIISEGQRSMQEYST